MSKKHFSRSLKKAVVGILVLQLLPISYFMPLFINKVKASSQLVLTPVADTFVRENVPNRNYGSWNDMTIGRAWNLGNYFGTSYSYIKFDLPGLNSQSIIHSATLEVSQYVRSDYASGNYLVNVARANSNWSELGVTWNNKPSFSGVYAQTWVDGYSGQWFRPPKKFSWNVTNLVREWANGAPNYGLVLYMSSGNYGGFWCSRNYNNATCFDYSQPRLVIDYTQNHPPNIPNPASPVNMAEFNNPHVTLQVKGLGDPDGNLDGTWFYFKRQRDANWQVSPKRTGQHTAQFTTNLSDGVWQWRARSRDTMNAWSNYSATRTFTVDTTPPSQPYIEDEPDFSAGNQNTVLSSLSTDALIGGVQYKFRVFRGEACSTFIDEGEWQDAREFTISNLEHNGIYCYQVKSRDKLGNENNWSEFEKSQQDAIAPEIRQINLSNDGFSPNGDGILDTVDFSFEVFDEYFERWDVFITNISDEVIRSFTGNLLMDVIVWDGQNANGAIVSDGPYKLELRAYDMASNEVVDDSNVVIVDNTAATLNISQPVDGAWFNSDSITIAGITEPNASLSVNSEQLAVDQNGIFEVEFPMDIGENVFEIVAVDIVGNSRSEQIKVYKELDVPYIEVVSPKGLVNDQKQVISLQLTDTNSTTAQSGIDTKSVYLSVVDLDNNELVLVNNGQNVQTNLGHIETDCISEITGGSLACSYSYIFDNALQPDGDYKIKAQVSDVATNSSELAQQGFTLDSHTYLEISSPSHGSLFNHSEVAVSGEAELGSKLSVISDQLSVNLEVEEGEEGILDCREVGEELGVGWQGIKTICNFSIVNLQLEADFNNNIYTTNSITFTLTDPAGNILEEERTVEVNLFAVSLSISGNLEYISPNGDGRQDGIDFELETYNRDSGENDVMVEEWEIRIRDVNGYIASLSHGQNSLPPSYYWDGTDNNGDWLTDGEYNYSLWIETTDGIEFETDPVAFYVKTFVEGEVIITNPKDGAVTTRGVINIQGQAPLDTVVTLCVDMIGIDGDCNDEQVLDVDKNGFFTGIAPLATKESYLWAMATDEAGNKTERSNLVKVILDFSEPLISVQALPSLAGIDQEVILRSLVTENTEHVKMRFADWSDLSELPEGIIDWYKIGEVDNFDDDNLDDSCDLSRCTWDYSWITPEVTGGVYEIRFIGKKGEMYKTMSIGIRIDGTIPVVPTIVALIKSISLENLRKYQEDYYTNIEEIVIKGIAEPLTFVHLLVDDIEIAEVKANAVGKWGLAISLPEPSDYKKYVLTSTSSDNVNNESEASIPVGVTLDKIPPLFEELTTSNVYHKSGTIADCLVRGDEPLFGGSIVRGDSASFVLRVDATDYDFIGSFDVESDAPEGDYIVNVFIEDFAGNVGNDNLSLVIDNTSPEPTVIDSSNWGKYNGIGAKADIPAKGRLVPEYVIRGRELVINGKAEQFSTVEIWMNSKKLDEVETSDMSCSSSTKAYGDVYYKLCDWMYELRLGAFERGYIIQTKVKDRAENKSNVSNGKLLYYDKTAPYKPVEHLSGDYWNDDGLGRISNKLSVNLKGRAERLSDLEIWLSGPASYNKYYFLQTSKVSEWERVVNLGNNYEGARDGWYTIKVKSTDAAGNGSEVLQYSIERDTVAPANPSVNEPYLCGASICLRVSGEDNAKVFINGRYFGKTSQGGQIFRVINSWRYDTLYRFEVYLADRARNQSGRVRREIKTPPVPRGDVEGVSTESPWGNQFGNTLPEVRFDVIINPDGSYSLSNVFIPVPEITRVYTTEDDKVEVYGVAIEKKHRLVANISRKYMTYYEAGKACSVGYFISAEDRKCMEGKMGINSLISWSAEVSKSCFPFPWCVENKKKELREEKNFGGQSFEVEHVMVAFHKDGGGDPYIGNLWNDSADGRFKKVYNLGEEVNIGDWIKARVVIFGDFEFDGVRIDYRGINSGEAWKNEGLSSGFSEREDVKENEDKNPWFRSMESVVAIPKRLTQVAFEPKTHYDNAAVDISAQFNTLLKATMNGYAEYNWDGGVWIRNEYSEYEVLYAHVSNTTANLYKNGRVRQVNVGDLVAYVGDVGAPGRYHVHYEIFHINYPKPQNGSCNSERWKVWRENMKPYLDKITLPYVNIDNYGNLICII